MLRIIEQKVSQIFHSNWSEILCFYWLLTGTWLIFNQFFEKNLTSGLAFFWNFSFMKYFPVKSKYFLITFFWREIFLDWNLTVIHSEIIDNSTIFKYCWPLIQKIRETFICNTLNLSFSNVEIIHTLLDDMQPMLWCWVFWIFQEIISSIVRHNSAMIWN